MTALPTRTYKENNDMGNLNFDPLFDASLPETERPGRKVERMPSSHKNSKFNEDKHKASKIRDTGLNIASKIITVAGVILCIAVVAAVAVFGWQAAGF